MFSFLKNNHYIWDTGLSGHLSWAPLGTKIKRKVEDYLRHGFEIFEFDEIETSLIYRKEVWENSGHWDRFQDPIIRTQKGRRLRVDKLLEEHFPGIDYSSLSETQVLEKLHELNSIWREGHAATKNQASDEEDDPDLLCVEPKLDYQSLMIRCESGSQEAGLRPETATATYFHYADLLVAKGRQMPLKVFQIGRSFRNEISPKHSLIRGREFTQAEFQMILPVEAKTREETVLISLDPDLLNQTVSLYVPGEKNSQRTPISKLAPGNPVFRALIALVFGMFERLGFSSNKLRLRQHGPDEMAFYALDAYDIEIDLKGLGWTEIAGVHDRGGWDLRHLGEDVEIPHILEVAIGVDRLVYAIIDRLYEEKSAAEGKTTLNLPYFLAPIQVSVLPLMKNRPELVKKAREVYRMLKQAQFTAEYAEKKSIGKRYLDNAKRGIPWSITIDYDTLADDTVTVRDRDTEAQIRVPVTNLRNHLLEELYSEKVNRAKVGDDIKGGEVGDNEVNDEYISISRCDFRVGRIVAIEKHPNADSLYVEKIDLGEDNGPRTIISGLVNHVPIEDMKDRLVVVFANLKASNMKSIKSYGMVMCAVDNEHIDVSIEVLDPPDGVMIGERITVQGEEGEADKLINLRKKNNCPWPDIAKQLTVNVNGEACFRDKVLMTSAGPIRCKTLTNCQIR